MGSKNGKKQKSQKEEDDVTFSSSTTVLASNKNSQTQAKRTMEVKAGTQIIPTRAIAQSPLIISNAIVRQHIRVTADTARNLPRRLRRIYIRWRFSRFCTQYFRVDVELARDLSSLSPDCLAQVGIETGPVSIISSLSSGNSSSITSASQQGLEPVIEEPGIQSVVIKIQESSGGIEVTLPTGNEILPSSNQGLDELIAEPTVERSANIPETSLSSSGDSLPNLDMETLYVRIKPPTINKES